MSRIVDGIPFDDEGNYEFNRNVDKEYCPECRAVCKPDYAKVLDLFYVCDRCGCYFVNEFESGRNKIEAHGAYWEQENGAPEVMDAAHRAMEDQDMQEAI